MPATSTTRGQPRHVVNDDEPRRCQVPATSTTTTMMPGTSHINDASHVDYNDDDDEASPSLRTRACCFICKPVVLYASPSFCMRARRFVCEPVVLYANLSFCMRARRFVCERVVLSASASSVNEPVVSYTSPSFCMRTGFICEPIVSYANLSFCTRACHVVREPVIRMRAHHFIREAVVLYTSPSFPSFCM